MSEPKRVLFVTAPIGSGHMRAAQAIMKELERLQPGVQTKMANIFDFISPMLGNTIYKGYLKVLKYFPQAYGMAYGWGNTNKLALAGREIISRYMSDHMESFLMKYSPAAVVCTHATPAGMVAQLAKRGKLTIPSIAAVTDFTVHRLWVYPELDYYFVADNAMRDDLAKWGVPYNKSSAVGIPVDPAFLSQSPKEEILSKLGLNNHFKTVLIMGGGAGVLPMDKIVKACDQVDASFQIIVVAGNNQEMFIKLEKSQMCYRHPIKIVGFVNNVHELMAASDLLISKPGGMTTAEATSQGLPMLIFRPIPGQEEANTCYLKRKQAAIKVDSPSDVQKTLRRLLVEHPDELTRLKKNSYTLRQPEAAETIARHILLQIT
ncbi:Processive diacylglycerol beta-glucosyltransferase [bioreactor metagenome]|uniref:Processive diacylglycerol beta-glucosyltransferase n=1 Tax=bioreactor metagenome TaxID=1076179 RepID=A0A644T9W1_9ZZZZ|nr:glycosyltransferase [Negativicutes bacterium]